MIGHLLREGGPVVWVILGCGLAALGVFVERSLHLHRARIKAEDFLKGIFTIVARHNTDEALAICEDTPGPVAHLVKTAILHRGDTRERLREHLEDASLAEISRMERRLVFVATVAQITPLLGLLGTILGMVEALGIMQHEAPLIQSADVIRGLLKSLTGAGAGLTVAIPCYAAFNLLVVRIDRIVLDMERSVSEIVAFFGAQPSEPRPPAPER